MYVYATHLVLYLRKSISQISWKTINRLLLRLRDLTTPLWVLTMLDSILLVNSQLVFPEATKLVRFNTDSVIRLRGGDSLNSEISEGEPRGVVESEHRPRGSSGTFLDIAEDVESRSADMGLTGEEETGDIFGVTMEVDNDRLIGSEEGCEGLLRKSVGVGSDLAKNEKVVDVDHSDS